MKKNFKIIQLNGLTGIITALLILVTIVSCVTVLPVYVIKFLWNNLLANEYGIQTIRLSQAALLWGAGLALIYAQIKKRIRLQFMHSTELKDNFPKNINYAEFLEEMKKEELKGEIKNDEKINN